MSARPARSRKGPANDAEAWLRRQLAGLGLQAASAPTDPDESLLRCLLFVHLVHHYGPADRWAVIERFFEELIPEYRSPALWERPAVRWWLERRLLVQDVLLADVCRCAGGGSRE